MGEDKARPHSTDKARDEAEARRERQAAALRDNLKRRKAQARARADQPAASDDATSAD